MKKIISTFLSLVTLCSFLLIPNVGLSFTVESLNTSSNNSSNSSICTNSQDVPQAECEALVDLYNNTNGENWTYNNNWKIINGSTDVCDWYGVYCWSNSVGNLSLPENNLVGSIPATLGNLTNLQSLYLINNQLSGSIPPELGNLSALFTLRLSNNKLTGTIPSELGNLSNLVILYLNSNQLSGAIPPELGNLSNLDELHLSSNQLSESIPSELGNLSSLDDLYLYSNQLSGSIPSELGNLSSLNNLYLYSNQLSGSIPSELGNLFNLDSLYLYSNQLSGSIPSSLSNLTVLNRFYIHNNPDLTGPIPHIISYGGSFAPLLSYYNTNICVPNNPTIQDWVNDVGIHYGTGLICDAIPGKITGTVTNLSGDPLSNIQVSIYQIKRLFIYVSSDDLSWKYRTILTSERTNNLGQYEFNGLGEGVDYLIRFADSSNKYTTEYYNNQLTMDDSDAVNTTFATTVTNINAVLGDISVAPKVANVSVNSGSATTDPATGLIQVNMPASNRQAITWTYTPVCSDSSTPTNISLRFSTYSIAKDYLMANTNNNQFTATIPANDVLDNSGVFVVFECDSQTYNTIDIGNINLYDSKNVITNINTDEFIANATVTLHYILGWSPKTSPFDTRANTCESNQSKPSSTQWSQTTPSSLGVIVDPTIHTISPSISTQITGDDGEYNWDLSLGCWYVTVSASGYQTLTSPVIGTSSELVDLNLKLTPTSPPAIPNIPQPMTPRCNNQIIDSAPLFEWTPAIDAVNYQFLLMEVDNTEPVENTYGTNLPNTYYQMSSIPNGNYYWRVRGQNSLGQWGDFSLSCHFTKADAYDLVGEVTLLEPLCNRTSSDMTPLFKWSPVINATNYQFLLMEVDNPTPIINTFGNVQTNSQYQTNTMVDGDYFWRVRAQNGAAIWGEWSESCHFRLDKDAPQLDKQIYIPIVIQ